MKDGATDLDALTANNDPRTAEAVKKAREAIIAGTLEPFSGPLKDQAGVEKVAVDKKMTDDEIWNMAWFVEGVVGVIP